jgi:hypothetical protein
MVILRTNNIIQWGELSLPVWGLGRDWYGEEIAAPLMFSLAIDSQRLWLVTAGKTPSKIHPQARPGAYIAELWRYDCAELFLSDSTSGRYLEFNLAANGAWWSSEFVAPRQRADELDIAFPEVATFAELSAEGAWMSAMALPLDLLESRIGFSIHTRVNVTFITHSPAQQFLSATKLPGSEPDFHQPVHFSSFQFHDIDE